MLMVEMDYGTVLWVDFYPVFFPPSVVTLRWSDNGDVHENVAEKQTWHHFKHFGDYPNSPCYLKEGDFGWSWREGNALKFGQRL